MSFALTTSQAILLKAGNYVNSTQANSGALMVLVADMAESAFCIDTKYDWITNVSKIRTSAVASIKDAVSNYAGVLLIENDMSVFTGLGEGTTMVNILLNNYKNATNKYGDPDIQDWARSTT